MYKDKRSILETEYYIWDGIKFFPGRNKYYHSVYYNNSGKSIEAFSSGNVLFNKENQTLSSEFAAGYGAFLRISVGGLISRVKLKSIDTSQIRNKSFKQIDSVLKVNDSINKNISTIQNFIAGGGNAYLTLSTPVIDYLSNDKTVRFNIGIYDRLAMLLAVTGVESNFIYGVNDLGGEASLFYNFTDEQDKPSVSFYLRHRSSLVKGIGDFSDNLGLKKTSLFTMENYLAESSL